ncbi:MAG TPA: response regulator [Syntrophobacteraceae bacterium]|nr:response regulator [Syntrophobacteraceae bacterium]
MPVVNVLSGSYCGAEEVVRSVIEKTGYRYLDDAAVVAATSKRFSIEESRIWKALQGRASIFNKFTHEKERSLACLQQVVADLFKGDDFLLFGLCSLMVPRRITHALNVLIIADTAYRSSLACLSGKISAKEAAKKIHRDDESLVLWVEHLYRQKDPWAPALYDIVIPMNKVPHDDAVRLICDNLKSSILTVSRDSLQAVSDFGLASKVNVKLTAEGHDVSVSAKDGMVVIEINKHVVMLASLEEELKRLASTVPGVKRAETKVGPGYYQSDVYRKFDLDLPLPSKVLLVDDERDFVEALSERLQMRDYSSAVVYDGHEALSIVEEDEPDVMVLDLKMPGIDGLEVLRRVKEQHPRVEVIVLTGHGSEDVARQCIELGACTYLEKPVDIEKLTRAMREAYTRVKEAKAKTKDD